MASAALQANFWAEAIATTNNTLATIMDHQAVQVDLQAWLNLSSAAVAATISSSSTQAVISMDRRAEA